MRLNAMALGIISWTLAVGLPAVYNVALARIAMKDPHQAHDVRELARTFNQMPAVMWLYTIAMAFVGLMLISYGLRKRRLEEELSI